MKRNGVHLAFEILLEELEKVANALNEDGAEALKRGDYDKAQEAIAKAKRLADLRDRVKALQKEWNTLFASQETVVKRQKARKKRERLQRGLRTPEDAFRLPILETLEELGGRGTVAEVLERVEAKMKSNLNRCDYEPLPSSGVIRWRNTAQWCRNTLVKEGLMKSDSPRGIWEISEKGREFLRNRSG